MNEPLTAASGARACDPGSSAASNSRTELATLLFTDMVDSTALKQRLGDRAAAAFFAKHHSLLREILAQFPKGREIETAGDSFLIHFATPSDAVHFALLVESRCRALAQEANLTALDRIGIHLGEVMITAEPAGAKPGDLFGIQIDTCARIMGLAQAGQILMTRSVFDSARPVLKSEAVLGPLEWLNHGPYLLKGLDQPIEVCEVRPAGQSTFGPPLTSEKARRQIRPGEEEMLGWRPALGQVVPNSRWSLEKKLGEGGFGEVWLGRNPTTRERRVFKFCFTPERVRFLKRELTLFRLLKERIGDHPGIVRLHDVYLDRPPFYVEMDYVEGTDLQNWSSERGGPENIPLELRLEVVAQAADSLEAAHQAGIVHRDIKPGNILIADGRTAATADSSEPKRGLESARAGVTVKLTDFGIGQVVSEDYLAGITRAGFTKTMAGESSSSQTGTQLYLAPELLAGKPASTRSDIYSLGVVLYQLMAGDFRRPVTTDWAKRIADPLLREDLQRCLAGEPEERFGSAAELARQLRRLPERRAERARLEQEKAELEKAAYRRGALRTAGLAAGIVAIMATLAGLTFTQSQRAKAAAESERRQRTAAERNLYSAKLNLAQQAWERNYVGRMRQLLEETAGSPERGFEWYYWQRQLHLALTTLRGHLGGVKSAAFSPDGRRILTGGWDQTAKLWDASTGQELHTLQGHSGPIVSVAFAPNGQRLVTGSEDLTARIWDAVTGQSYLTLRGHHAAITSVTCSPDGRQIATCSRDRTARLWDASTGQQLHTLSGHEDAILSVAFSGDGQWIVTAGRDRTARIWNAATGRQHLILNGQPTSIPAVACSPDGRWIVTGNSDRTARIWDAVTGQERFILTGHNGGINSVAWSPDGRWIATASDDHTARIWDAATGLERLVLKGHDAILWSVAFSPDSQHIVTSSEDLTARIWDATTQRDHLAVKGHGGIFTAVAFAPDGRSIVSASDDRTAKVWDAATGRERLTLAGHGAVPWSAAFSPDGQWIVTGSWDLTARVWDASSGLERVVIRGHSAQIQSVAVGPNQQRIVTGSSDQTAKLWDAATGAERLTLKGHQAEIWAVAFSRNGQWIATGSGDRTIKTWDAVTGEERLTLHGHAGAIRAVSFSPDDRQIVSASEDHTAKIWDRDTGRERLTLIGHTDAVRTAAFSPDGRRIVSGSLDRTAKVWDAATGQERLTLSSHNAPVFSVAFSPDGRRIVTGGADQVARVFEAATPEQVAAWDKEETAATQRVAARRQELAAAIERDRAVRLRDPGAIKRWLVLAPIPYEGQNGAAALEQEQLPDEARLRPAAGQRVQIGGQERIWTAVESEDYLLNFNRITGEATQWSVAYAVCYLRLVTAQDGLQVKVGSDDQARVYLDGKEIHRTTAGRPYSADQDVIGDLELAAGNHVLVFKVINVVGGFMGSVRLTDRDGNPVQGLSVSLEP